jgi:hypothetical protein
VNDTTTQPRMLLRQHVFTTRRQRTADALARHAAQLGLLHRFRPAGKRVETTVFYPCHTGNYRLCPDTVDRVDQMLLDGAVEGAQLERSATLAFTTARQLRAYVEQELGTPGDAVDMMPQVDLTGMTRRNLRKRGGGGPAGLTAAELAAVVATGLVFELTAVTTAADRDAFEKVRQLLHRAVPEPVVGAQYDLAPLCRLDGLFSTAPDTVQAGAWKVANHGPARTRANYLTGMARLDFTQTVDTATLGALISVLRWRHVHENPASTVDLSEYAEIREALGQHPALSRAWEHDPDCAERYTRMRTDYLATRHQPEREQAYPGPAVAMAAGGFYEIDENAQDVAAAFDAGRHCMTSKPPPSRHDET